MDWNSTNYQRATDGEIIHEMVVSSWLTRTIKSTPFVGRILSHSEIFHFYRRVGGTYLRMASAIADFVELGLFISSVLLVNAGFLYCGIGVGVIGIVASSNIEDHYRKLEIRRATEDVAEKFYDRMSQQERLQNNRRD